VQVISGVAAVQPWGMETVTVMAGAANLTLAGGALVVDGTGPVNVKVRTVPTEAVTEPEAETTNVPSLA
jgi:uncharacterized protein (DUF2345 family)